MKTPEQILLSYRDLVEHLRWSFDYEAKRMHEAEMQEADKDNPDSVSAHDHYLWAGMLAHEVFQALKAVDETQGRECPCNGCVTQREEDAKKATTV